MTTNNSQKWAIGCKIVQWRINTQLCVTNKDTHTANTLVLVFLTYPYLLLFYRIFQLRRNYRISTL